MTYLTAFIELFRFIKRYRQRADARLALEAQERAEERAHQRAMLETIFTKMVDAQRASNEGILTLADAQRAQASVMQTWLDGFRISDPTPTPASVVRPEEEWVREQLRLDELGLADASLNLPPEFSLAFQLAQQDSGDFDREGPDF